MTYNALSQYLEEIVDETATISKKEKDRLLDAICDFMINELGVEVDEEEEEE
jgi:ribosome assembly protein YihI (activator of Der GTPase)